MASQATLTTVNALTKELYQGRIREQLQDEVVGLRRIERSSNGVTSEVGGKYVTFPIRVGRNSGIGYREEDETLQEPGAQQYARVNVGLKYGYGRIKLTGPTLDLAESNQQAFASALDREMMGIKDDISKDSARIFYGDGTGAWTKATGAATGQVIPVEDVQNFFGQIGAKLDVIAPSANIADVTDAAYDPANSTINAPLYGTLTTKNTGPLTLTAVDVANSTITVTGTIGTVAAGDHITRAGNFGREPYGLAALIGTGKIFNVDPAAVPVWQSTINDNGGTARPLSESLMIKMTDDVRVHGGKTSLILTSLGVRRAYFNLLTQQRRYNNTKEFAGGMTGLAFNNGREIPVVEDVDAPKGKMWFLDESAFTVYRDKDWAWLNQEGSTWKWVQNKDAYEAVLKQYWQIGLDRRNAQGLASDISEA